MIVYVHSTEIMALPDASTLEDFTIIVIESLFNLPIIAPLNHSARLETTTYTIVHH